MVRKLVLKRLIMGLCPLTTGMIGNPINDYTEDGGISIPVESVPDVQMRDLITDAVITIPSSLAGVVDLLSSIKSAVTAKTVAVAAAPAIDVIYGELATDHEDEHAGVYPWLPDITKSLGVISDMVKALSKTLTNVKDNVIAGTKALTGSLADVVTAVKSIPATIATDISSTKVADVGSYAFADLKSLFPFCLSFDLIDFIGVLSAPPEAPHFQWVFPAVSRFGIPAVTIDIDLSKFNSIAAIVRTMETLGFIVGLVMITRSHMIRG